MMRYNPLQIFQGSKSPAGLYARAKWLHESETSAWRDDFHATVSSLMHGQKVDGSWSQSSEETLRRLFGLHLTLRERTKPVDQALEWLIQEISAHHPAEMYADDWPDGAFQGMPFVKAQQPLTQICATLFLACVYGRAQDAPIEKYYQWLIRWLGDCTEKPDIWPEKSNALRALIVHPVYAQDPRTLQLVDELSESQKDSGLWPAPIPFFLTVNALAHLAMEPAHRQWLKALPLLSGTQKKNGSWGNHDSEWNTFLVVHALKNKQFL
jgi:hypothetical protein